MRASKATSVEGIVTKLEVRLTKWDLVKVFLAVVAAEIAAHWSVSRELEQRINDATERGVDKINNWGNRVQDS